MKPFGPLLFKLLRLRRRVRVENRRVLHAPTQQTDAGTVLEINGRVEKHRRPRMRQSILGALCVVMGLSASVAMSNATEREGPYAIITDSFNAVIAAIMAPAGDPISPPTPRAKPKPTLKEKPALAEKPAPEPGVVAQCGAATIISKLASDGGCGQFYQGCNVCSIRYDGCAPEDKALCKTSKCLERTCTRRVVCSSKACIIRGNAPTCEARMARTSCLKPMFK